MAQPQTLEVPVHIVIDVTEARRLLRRVIADAKALNRELAAVEDAIAKHEANWDAHVARVQELGIRLESA